MSLPRIGVHLLGHRRDYPGRQIRIRHRARRRIAGSKRAATVVGLTMSPDDEHVIAVLVPFLTSTIGAD